MKKKTLATLFLSLCLCAQLNLCSADNNYDEEITLPIGTNFDLEMEEVTRYEYDGEYVKALTVNNKEQFILQKAGDTIITVIMDDKGVKTELKVLVHIVSEQQFNNPTATKPGTTPATTTPGATTPGTATNPTAAPGTTTPGAIGVPAATAKDKAAATTPSTAKPSTTKPEATKPAAATPAATKPNTTKSETATQKAAQPTEPSKTTTTTANKEIATPAAPAKQGQAQQSQQAVAPAKPTAIVTSQTITRPTAKPQNNNEAIKYKADQYAFDVLDLINAERAKYSLRPLSMAKDLQNEAVIRARELTSRFSHTRPDGSKFFTVMSDAGVANGENIAAGQTTPAAVVKAWMNSSAHREAILSPAYSEIGVGYYETTTANYPCYWIQLFRG